MGGCAGVSKRIIDPASSPPAENARTGTCGVSEEVGGCAIEKEHGRRCVFVTKGARAAAHSIIRMRACLSTRVRAAVVTSCIIKVGERMFAHA